MPQVMNSPTLLENESESLNEIRKLADLMDSKYSFLGWRIGWDGILGLIPGIGDFATNLVSFYILYKAALLGCPFSVLSRMGLNLLIDNVLDTLPLVGNLFDFAWRANLKTGRIIPELRQPGCNKLPGCLPERSCRFLRLIPP